MGCDGRKILTSNGTDIILWDFKRNKQKKMSIPNINFIYRYKYGLDRESMKFEFSKDGRYILSYQTKNGEWTHTTLCSIRVWDAHSGKKINDFHGHSNWLLDAHFSNSGNYIISSSKDSTARIWEISSGKILHEIRVRNASIYDVNFSKDGNTAIISCSDN